MATEGRQYVRFLFLKVDPEWRRGPGDAQALHKAELGDALRRFRARLLLRTFSLVGTRGDTELLLWQVADDLGTFQRLQTAVFSTRLGAFLTIAHSYLGMTRRSVYELGDDAGRPLATTVRPQDAAYLFVYPFVKTREWYALPAERRQAMMEEHIRVGRSFPGVRLNTLYSFGLDDQEFVLAFEADEPAEFVDLVMRLRETAASAYTLRDTPVFTCLQMSIWDALDALGGAPPVEVAGRHQDGAGDGFTQVASLADLPDGASRRVYHGADALALFNVGGRVFAVSDRCTHGRASLSEGTVEPVSCVLRCPWHGGAFDLATGRPAGDPVRAPLRTYRVRLDGERILVG